MASIASTTKDLKILIKQTFQLIDTDNNGTISKTELIRMFKNADVNAKKHIDEAFTRMDTDNDGHVDQAEFEAFMNEIHATFEIGEKGGNTLRMQNPFHVLTEFIASHSAVDDKYNHELKRFEAKRNQSLQYNGGGIEFNRDAQLLFATASNGLSRGRYYTNVLNDFKKWKNVVAAFEFNYDQLKNAKDINTLNNLLDNYLRIFELLDIIGPLRDFKLQLRRHLEKVFY